jgi:hypothetical protein
MPAPGERRHDPASVGFIDGFEHGPAIAPPDGVSRKDDAGIDLLGHSCRFHPSDLLHIAARITVPGVDRLIDGGGAHFKRVTVSREQVESSWRRAGEDQAEGQSGGHAASAS